MKNLGFLHNRPSIKFLINEAIKTFQRFPFVIIVATLTAVYGIYCLENTIRLPVAKLFFSLTLGIPLFFATAMLRESRGWNQLSHRLIDLLFGASFIGLHFWLTKGDETGNYELKYLQLSICLHLLGSFIAFTKNGDDNEFWQFNRQIFLRILLSVLYAVVFWGGLSIGLVTTDQLFKLDIDQIRYAEIWMISILILQTWHFLAGVPKLQNLKSERSYPQGLRFFVQYLLIPLVSLYTLILYVYMSKILVTWNWPNGYIGWLVSIMSVLGIFNLLLIYPEKNSSENRWIGTYSKAYYILILPLLGMLFVAIGKRVAEYGVTEQRYFLFVLGALLTGLAIYFIFSAKKNIKAIPISLFVVGLLTLWGPWGAYDYSMRNQKNRAQEILQRNGLLEGETLRAATAEVSKEDQKELSSIFDYLLRNHGSQAFGKWFPEQTFDAARGGNSYNTDLEFRHQRSQPLMEHLSLKYTDRWDNEQPQTFSFQSDLSVDSFQIEGFRQVVTFDYQNYLPERQGVDAKTFRMDDRELSYRILNNPWRFVIKEASKELVSIPLLEVIERKQEAPMDPISVDAGEKLKVRLLIREISGEDKNGSRQIYRMDGMIFFK